MSDQQAQSTNFKEAFSLFDKRGNGRVALPDLGDLLRACGQNPTLAEIKDLESQMGGDCKETYKRDRETRAGILTQRHNSRL
jgi:Ca2+-binding EF-hand superfamily protein